MIRAALLRLRARRRAAAIELPNVRIVNFRIADFGLLNAPVAAPLPGLTWGYKDPPAVIRHKRHALHQVRLKIAEAARRAPNKK